jgi:hypothetical protein
MQPMCWHSFVNWLHDNEAFAIWLEGIALVAIFFLDFLEYRKQGQERRKEDDERRKRDDERAQHALDRTQQHEETAEQMDIWRRQIHADRVASIFEAVRDFRRSIEKAVEQGVFGPGKWFHLSAELSEAYAELREAQYLSYLVNDNLATYIMDRIADAVALQRVPDNPEFSQKHSLTP